MNICEKCGEYSKDCLCPYCEICSEHCLDCKCTFNNKVIHEYNKQINKIQNTIIKCVTNGCRSLETRCKDCGRVVNSTEIPTKEGNSGWVSCEDMLPPKKGKFLFSYYSGIGLGCWGQYYTVINGNSERTHKAYILILWPSEILDGDDPLCFDEEKMKEMEMFWMPLPEPPRENGMD